MHACLNDTGPYCWMSCQISSRALVQACMLHAARALKVDLMQIRAMLPMKDYDPDA